VGLTAEADAVPAIPHPRIAEAYRRQVEALEGLLAEGSMEAREALAMVRRSSAGWRSFPTPRPRMGCCWRSMVIWRSCCGFRRLDSKNRRELLLSAVRN
jgi:hypothetical protein